MISQTAWAGSASWADLATSWTGADLYVPGSASALSVGSASSSALAVTIPAMTSLTIATPTMTGA